MRHQPISPHFHVNKRAFGAFGSTYAVQKNEAHTMLLGTRQVATAKDKVYKLTGGGGFSPTRQIA